MMRTSEVLDLAADAIQQRGWTQFGGWNTTADFSARVLGDHTQHLCLEGGIMAALGLLLGDNLGAPEDLRICPAYIAVQDYLDRAMPLYLWNDDHHRTADEVIEVLRAAAAVERPKESAYETDDQPLPLEMSVA